jgi:hypothetical protein
MRKAFFIYSLLRKQRLKYSIILIIIIFLFDTIGFSSSKKDTKVNPHYIFTFWEPSSSLPGYIKLCIKTWKKYLPNDYKIIVLDYHNLRNYLNVQLIDKILYKQMTLPIQADAIRVAILQKYGGIWMDSDTIITNSQCLNLFNGSDLIMFGNSKNKNPNIGFIYASKNSTILKAWMDSIIENIRIYKFRMFLKVIFPIKYFIKSFNELLTWNYLGNGILNKLLEKAPKKSFKFIQREEAYVLPEIFFHKGPLFKNYHKLYFTNRDPGPLLKKCKGILMLHNSWTPKKYKKMSEEEFLQQDIMLAHLFSRLLNNSKYI